MHCRTHPCSKQWETCLCLLNFGLTHCKKHFQANSVLYKHLAAFNTLWWWLCCVRNSILNEEKFLQYSVDSPGKKKKKIKISTTAFSRLGTTFKTTSHSFSFPQSLPALATQKRLMWTRNKASSSVRRELNRCDDTGMGQEALGRGSGWCFRRQPHST